MAINFPTMPKFTPEEAGALPDLQQAIMQGLGNYMQLQTQPKQMAQDFLAKQLANKMAGVQAQYAEPTAQANLELLQARRAKALQPSVTGLSPLEKAISGMQRIRQQYGVESPEAKMAQDYASRLAAGPAGMSFGVDKEGNITFSQGGVAGGAKLKTGESYVTDDQGKPIGIAAPPTTEEAKEISGGASFNYTLPIMNQGSAPYLGKGGATQIAQDIYNQESSPEAKERLINLIVAKKLSSAAAIKENATLGGSNTLGALNQIKKSFSNIGLPENVDNFLGKYAFSNDVLTEADRRFVDVINQMREASASAVPARKVRYFEGLAPKKQINKPTETKTDLSKIPTAQLKQMLQSFGE
jgi:hypothetical protein